MSKIDEETISALLADKFNLKFENKRFKLNGWGEADNYSKIKNGVYVFLEVETKQKHPHTNVMKLMPYLEENESAKIFLVQTFFADSPGLNSNRGRLGEWTANRFKNFFGTRFDYHKLIMTERTESKEFEEIRRKIKIWIHS